ncbi:ABC transporter permease [Chryseolinea soli]|uniref:FtsX-like permease family protein n=1 Tax=Chryseolinea soli TaxID=2321403 RepID=A0A385ST74_9BACT|nr:ABC transporter permease [Chryseolinea soli]AYB33521.1 FtsX-like permease family protein [Chryseolinea soli]
MAELTKDHIDYIIKDLHYRGIVLEGFEDEIIDHVCAGVEEQMGSGKKFIDAYEATLRSFGNTDGLLETQKTVIQIRTKTSSMFKSYFLLALRNHIRNKFYTAINVVGLAIGIASCIVIMLFVKHELSYDNFNEKADRIYRINTALRFGAVQKRLALGAAQLDDLFRQNYPEIESTTKLWDWGPRYVHLPERNERFQEKIVWADSTLFTVFTIPVLEGDARTALTEPNTVAISHTMAAKYFPDGNAVGKLLIIDDNVSHRVTAVFKDLPENSHFHYDMFRSIAGLPEAKNMSLIGGGWMNVYLLLREGADPHQLESKFPAFIEKYVAPQLADALQGDFTMDKFKSQGNSWSYWLTPVRDIHLHSDLEGDIEANGNITYVYLFSAIALFILIVACINFMNLSTARSANRAREVGIRKVMGSLRTHLVRQFLTESFVLTFISFVLALAFVWLFLPVFNNLALKKLSVPFDQPAFYVGLVAALVIVGFLAGLYPSFFLSSFKPVNVLKGKLALGTKSGIVRSSLVVFQFVISIFLIVGTIAIQKQLYYTQNKKIGFRKDQVIIVHGADHLKNHIQAFKDELLQNTSITAATISGYLPVSGTWRNNNTYWPEGKVPTGDDVEDMVSMEGWTVDYDYVNTLGMTIKTGRNFSREFLSDSTESVVLNESAVEKFEMGPNPLGKKISSFTANRPDGSPDPNSVKSWTVIGVVENFHFANMREHIAPLALFLQRSNGYVAFRFKSKSTQAVLDNIEAHWKKLAPGDAFEYSFLDEDYGKMYDAEKRLASIFGVFAGLAIIIACLGLFALAAFTAEQRTKEIGIRKTLGASVNSIVFLLSREYGKLVLIAFVVSTPVAWYGVQWWIQSYTYRATIGFSVYVLAGGIALVIALLTIGYQCVRAAMMNPAQSLRSE